jgi:hypothetical protein
MRCMMRSSVSVPCCDSDNIAVLFFTSRWIT